MMQFEEARQLSLERILMKLGFKSARMGRGGGELWYHSPFREEKTPSFKVDMRRNIWFDFGENRGGSPIDLIVHVFKTDTQAALKILSDLETGTFGGDETHPLPKSTPKTISSSMDEGLHSKDVFQLENIVEFSHQNTSLHQYIVTERCIDVKSCAHFLKTVFFKHLPTGNSFVAVGIENTEGGYEVRNPFFKGTIPESRKSFSWFARSPNNERLVCFEGMIDFLSYGTFFGRGHEDYLILNSTAYSKKAIEFLVSKSYTSIQTFFDNDRAGEEATFLFQKAFDNVEPKNAIFEEYKDFNAFLVAIKSSIK